MNHLSLAQKILNSKKTFVFFHTLCVTKDILQQAIDELKRNPMADLLDGQINIADELYKRIVTHKQTLIS